MILELKVAEVAAAGSDRHSSFGTIRQADADALRAVGSGHNIAGRYFTTDGNAVHFPAATDRFPTSQTNVVSIFLSMGAMNAMQQSDVHGYWEFNYTTNWVHPL